MDFSEYHPNELAGIVIAETLATLGVCDIILSPGSRSTPLTRAFSRDNRFNCYVVVDERSAGFFALGNSKKTGKPSVLVCTSGTAGANYLPAVIEARYSGTPLLILTADRPLVDQNCHAGQTVQQQGMFSNYVIHEAQLDTPQGNHRYHRYLRETLKNATALAMSNEGSVVHLNLPFELPLAQNLDHETLDALQKSIQETYFKPANQGGTLAFSSKASSRSFEMLDNGGFGKDGSIHSTLVIIGPGYHSIEDQRFTELVEKCERLSIPVLVDALHASRGLSARFSNIIWSYEWICSHELGRIQDSNANTVSQIKPDIIFQVGDLPTSKSLRTTMETWDCPVVSIASGFHDFEFRDPTYCYKVGSMEMESLNGFLDSVQETMLPIDDSSTVTGVRESFIEVWKSRQYIVQGVFQEKLSLESNSCTESSMAFQLSCLGSEGKPLDLFIANSMIIRDMENFYRGNSQVQKVYSNRGANGIDGVVSTAIGTGLDLHGNSVSSLCPLVCLIGDLTFLHDAGGLALANQQSLLESFSRKVVFVLLDNYGGGIFEHLPIATFEENFETHFSTPQNVDYEALCAAYRVDYRKLDIKGMIEFLKTASVENSDSPISCIHLQFDRKLSFQFRKDIKNIVFNELDKTPLS